MSNALGDCARRAMPNPASATATPANEGAGAPSGSERTRGVALIVDDDPAYRQLLKRMLSHQGFVTLEADSGEESLRLFGVQRPDIVFMDAMMPGLDGLETTRQIKRMAGEDFVPVIFVTALTDDDLLMRCIEAGGDDFLAKPFSTTWLKARILAMERVRDLHRDLAVKQRNLCTLLEDDLREKRLAERIWSQAVKNRNVHIDAIGLVERPAAIFNGDLVLVQYLPDGGLRLLLGDFTGHGLAATIGALPVADIFHTMTRKGMGDAQLLQEINRKLCLILPTGYFMAACLISISGQGDSMHWWNGGMPGAWLRTVDGLRELDSHELPLGIVPDLIDSTPRHVPVSAGDRLLLMTDGLLEANDAHGRMFVDARFQTVLRAWGHGTPVLSALLAAFDEHTAGTEQADDVAVVEIPLDLDGRAPCDAAKSIVED